jgi:outer membrane protein assembly factor BamA
MSLLGGASIPTGRYKIVYTAVWPALAERLSLDLRAHASQLEVRNFYGFGNDSPRDEDLEEEGFYRVSSREFLFQPVIRYATGSGSSVGAGFNINNFKVREEEDQYLNSAFVSYGDDRTIASVGLLFLVDSRDHPLAPHKGVLFGIQAWNFVEVNANEDPFQKFTGDLRFYLGDTLGTDLMLAMRIHGEILDGDFPFYESAFLGGIGSLRGYSSQRFAGDVCVFGSVDLRASIGRWKVVIPTEIGVFLLADAGRVWVDAESPGTLHADWGGGIWMAPLNRDALLSFSVAASPEGVFVGGGLGFAF